MPREFQQAFVAEIYLSMQLFSGKERKKSEKKGGGDLSYLLGKDKNE